MLGVNKFIGGTYRNTTLEEQQLNQSKSSAEIMASAYVHQTNFSKTYDISNYEGSRDAIVSTPVPSLHKIEQSLIIGSQSLNKIPLAPNKMPKWARAVPVNPSYEQKSTLPRQIRDKQQASEQKLLEN